MATSFKNLIGELYNLYVLNTHVKFHTNQILFIIRIINLIFIHNFRLQKL